MRKTLMVEIEEDGRDFGKAFKITEMSAYDAERWALQLGFALMNSGADLGDGEIKTMSDMARVGIFALSKLTYDQAEPLLDKLMACIQTLPDSANPSISRSVMESDIEEVATRIKLKKHVFDLHCDFFTRAAPLTTE